MTSGELFVHSALTCVVVAWLNNVLPDDHSRVILRSVSGQAGDSTYINANYIEGYYKPRSYIACQVSRRAGLFLAWPSVVLYHFLRHKLFLSGFQACL